MFLKYFIIAVSTSFRFHLLNVSVKSTLFVLDVFVTSTEYK